MMDQMNTPKQNFPLWLESTCMSMEIWMTMASMKVSGECVNTHQWQGCHAADLIHQGHFYM